MQVAGRHRNVDEDRQNQKHHSHRHPVTSGATSRIKHDQQPRLNGGGGRGTDDRNVAFACTLLGVLVGI